MENYNYNPGVFGSNFNWWIGQIVDSSFWKDNVYPTKYSDPKLIPGWGRRYKVRIIGLHDIGAKEIPSEQLPWAQIIYPVTAGGGQGESYQSPNLRTGNMVFGFFFDGPDMQVPVILGVIGNNSKNELSMTSEDGRFDSNNAGANLATSAYSTPKDVVNEDIQERIPLSPDEGLTTKKPGSVPDVNQFKVKDFLETDEGKEEEKRIDNETNILDLSLKDAKEYKDKLLENLARQFSVRSNSAKVPATPGATRESVDNPHEKNVAQAKQTNIGVTKIPFIHPSENKVESSIKAIQTTLDNLLSTINNYIHTFQSYIDQASNLISDITSEIKKAARQMAKYMKVLMNKMREYLMKILNKAMAEVVSLLPQSLAHEFADIKQEVLDLIYCLFNKLLDKMDELLANLLIEALDIAGLEEKARKSVNNDKPYYTTTNESASMCYTENVVSSVIKIAADEIDDQIEILLNNVDKYANLAQEQLAQVDDQLENVSSIIENIQSSIADAAAFMNINANIFGCDIGVTVTMADFYSLSGGSAQPQYARVPSRETIEKSIEKPIFTPELEDTIPFAVPSPGQPTIKYRNSNGVQAVKDKTENDDE